MGLNSSPIEGKITIEYGTNGITIKDEGFNVNEIKKREYQFIDDTYTIKEFAVMEVLAQALGLQMAKMVGFDAQNVPYVKEVIMKYISNGYDTGVDRIAYNSRQLKKDLQYYGYNQEQLDDDLDTHNLYAARDEVLRLLNIISNI